MYFPNIICNFSKSLCVLPSTLCMTGELWPWRFIWHQDIRVTHCQSSAMSFIFAQYSFCNSFRHSRVASSSGFARARFFWEGPFKLKSIFKVLVTISSYWGTGDSTAGFNTELLAIFSKPGVRSEQKFFVGASFRHTKGFWAAKKLPKEYDLPSPPCTFFLQLLADPGKSRGCSTNGFVTHWLIHSVTLFLPQLYAAATPKRLQIDWRLWEHCK